MKLQRSAVDNFTFFLSTIIIANCIHDASAFNYPDEVSDFIQTWGCIPWLDGQCPARMICYVDPTYAYWGQCGCRNGWNYRMKPPQNLGDELAPAPHRNDCVEMGSINILSFLVQFLGLSLHCYMVFGAILNIYRVYKNGGLKMNGSTTSFFFFLFTNVGCVFRQILFTANRWGTVLDPYWNIKNALETASYQLLAQFSSWMTMESICTWFDLYQKSQTLSKRSTWVISVLRWALRIYAALFGILVFLVFMNWAGEAGHQSKFYIALQDTSFVVQTSCAAVVGALISRVLCKDIKDVTNPNWKAAAAIRDTAINYCMCHLGFWICIFRLIPDYGLWAHQALAMNNSFSIGAFLGFSLPSQWGWYQYLLFAHRRYLENYDISSASTVFHGFTSIGMKGSRASSIFQPSVKSSTLSANSAVSSSSVADSGKAQGEKGDTT